MTSIGSRSTGTEEGKSFSRTRVSGPNCRVTASLKMPTISSCFVHETYCIVDDSEITGVLGTSGADLGVEVFLTPSVCSDMEAQVKRGGKVSPAQLRVQVQTVG